MTRSRTTSSLKKPARSSENGGSVGIQVGVSPLTVDTAGETLMRILDSPNAEAVKIEAIKALSLICRVDNTSIVNCSITQGGR